MIDNAYDGGVDRRFNGIERESGFPAADEEHELARARAGGIGSDQRTADRPALFVHRLQQEQRE
jgi:hypothetical protein